MTYALCAIAFLLCVPVILSLTSVPVSIACLAAAVVLCLVATVTSD